METSYKAVKKSRLELRVETRAVVVGMEKRHNQQISAMVCCGRREIRKEWAYGST